MKIMYRTVAIVSMALLLTTGCVNPNGTPDNTGTGAIMGGGIGAVIGAIADRAHPGAGALIGGAAGLIAGGLVGHMIDQQNQQVLQQQYPQTWNKLQNNDTVYANSPPPAGNHTGGHIATASHSAANFNDTGGHSGNVVNASGDRSTSNAAVLRGRHRGAYCCWC